MEYGEEILCVVEQLSEASPTVNVTDAGRVVVAGSKMPLDEFTPGPLKTPVKEVELSRSIGPDPGQICGAVQEELQVGGGTFNVFLQQYRPNQVVKPPPRLEEAEEPEIATCVTGPFVVMTRVKH